MADKLNLPFKLSPAGKDYLWGGERLKKEFQKNIDMTPLAETWECSTHPEGPSVVSTGEFAGMLLSDVLMKNPEFIGSHPDYNGDIGLPILIKLIDADKNLSVQVHPDDEYAKVYENGQLGKNEFWYVLDAEKGAELIYGLNHQCDKDKIREYISNGELDNHLNYVSVKKNDVFFIKAGIIHAIGAGTLIAEIQQSSNLTYRMYDYDRTDKNGNKRELHVEKALSVANLESQAEPPQPIRVLKYSRGIAEEVLCRCKYFEVHRLLINADYVSFAADDISFRVLLCVDGTGEITFDKTGENALDKQDRIDIDKGDCIFVPANSVELKIRGKMQLLDIRC